MGIGWLDRARRRRDVWWALVPLGALLIGVAPHLTALVDNVALAHPYWHDAIGHQYLSWERATSLVGGHGFFDFRWFAPYPESGTYNEPALTHGALFGLFALGVNEALAFNLAMLAILALNAVALYVLLLDLVRRPVLAALFAILGALSPFLFARYAHPPNTVICWGLLGLWALRRAARRPTWPRCVAAPSLFVLQLFSSFYTGMFFVVLLLAYLPLALLRARRERGLRRLVLRAGLVSLLCLPALVWLQGRYDGTRRELGRVNSYEYVSDYGRKGTADFLPRARLTCGLRVFGVRESEADCREELFPGRLALLLALASLGGAAWWRWRRRRPGWRGLLRPGGVVAGAGLALATGWTLPFHLALWTALVWPGPGRRPAPLVAGPLPAAAALALLVADLALNPTIRLGGIGLQSAHVLFYSAIPGFDGLRSEYRVVVLLPVLLAIVGAVGARRFLGLGWWRGWDRSRRGVLVAAACLACTLDCQPLWQEYRPLPRSDRAPPVLVAARALPPEAVLAVVRGQGLSTTRRTHIDANTWLGDILLHRHRQVTGYSTLNTPASDLVEAAASTGPRAGRLGWVSRAARLFGATHLVVDWREAEAPEPVRAAQVLARLPEARLVAHDAGRWLIALGRTADTAAGPVADEDSVDPALVRPVGITAAALEEPARASDGDPSTAAVGGTLAAGDTVTLDFAARTCVAGLAFSPGLAVGAVPTAYDVQASGPGEQWLTVRSVERWEVPWSLVRRPGTGLVVRRFPPVWTTGLRFVVRAGSPFPWRLTEIAAVGCGKPGQR